MIERVNRLRAGHGLLPVAPSFELTRSAGHYAAWMLETDHLAHSATIQAPRRFRRLGETLAWHFGWTPSGAVTLMRWRRSPSHRDTLLNPGFDHIGAAFRRGSVAGVRATAWVAHLGG